MKRAAAKASLAAVLSLALGCGMLGIAACAERSVDPTYRTGYRTAEEYFKADLPVQAIKDEKEYRELGISRVTIDLTIRPDGTFRMAAMDSNSGTGNSRWERAYIVEGIYEPEEEGSYYLSKATYVIRRQKAGSEYKAAYGGTGSSNSRKDETLLSVFNPCTAILADTAVTYCFHRNEIGQSSPAPEQQ
ncbi:MAG: hypothetical protein LUE27_06265 [Clostridia bacterium]|nr:hypothetical protein [Clostridia bacterium]